MSEQRNAHKVPEQRSESHNKARVQKTKLLRKKMHKIAWPWFSLSIIIILFDQITKYFANHYLTLNEPFFVLPFLNFTLNYNPGAAFSFLGNADGWQVYLLAGISIVVSIVIFIWLMRTQRSDWLQAFALSLLLGGACGNLIDRIRFSYVIDFIDFHIKNWHFATFNIADSAISVGAFLLIIKLLFFAKNN